MAKSKEQVEDEKILDQIISTTPKVEIVTIRPGVAEALLERNQMNRKVVDRQVRYLSLQLKNGNWHLSNDAIVLDVQGLITNGQHRLMACVDSQIPIEVILSTGNPTESKVVYDTNVRRSFASQLSMRGTKYATMIGAAVNLRIRWEGMNGKGIFTATKGSNISVVSYDDAFAFMEKHPIFEDSVPTANRLAAAFPSVPASAALAFVTMILEKDVDNATSFINALVNGSDLKTGDPRLALRNFLTRTPKGSLTKTGASQTMLLVLIRTWNYWRSGRQIVNLRWSANEAPVLPI